MASPVPPAAPVAIPIPPNIAALTSPLIFGEIFNGYLFGVLTVQVYLYHITFPSDALYLKLLVYGLFLFETASTLMCLVDAYHWFGTGFGNVAALNDINLSAIDTPMMGAIIAAVAQIFYSYRIFRINPKAWPICVLVCLIALAEAAAGLFGGIVGIMSKTLSSAGARTLPAIYVVFIGAAVADIIIAITMIALLTWSRTKNHQQSNFVLTKILNLTVETNLLSTSLAILTMILLIGLPGTNYFTAPSFVLGKVYSNSLLLILNNRHYLAIKVEHGTSYKSSGMKMSNLTGSSGNGSTQIQTQTVVDTRDARSIHIDITRNGPTTHGSDGKVVYYGNQGYQV